MSAGGQAFSRPIGLGSDKTVGQRGRHALVSRRARTVARVNQTRITQGRAKKEMKDPKAITMKNGRPATQGTCPSCGTKMFRIGKV